MEVKVDDQPAKKNTLTFEKAVSGRAKCKATGEIIAKGEERVGLEAFVSGRVSMTWQVGRTSEGFGLSCHACTYVTINL